MAAAVLLYGMVLVLTRYSCSDDAFIAFFTLYNFIQGFGLTWNVSERVQAYSYPLLKWVFREF